MCMHCVYIVIIDLTSFMIDHKHSIRMNSVSTHVALRMLLAFLSKSIAFSGHAIKTLNWLVAASKLHKHRRGMLHC